MYNTVIKYGKRYAVYAVHVNRLQKWQNYSQSTARQQVVENMVGIWENFIKQIRIRLGTYGQEM